MLDIVRRNADEVDKAHSEEESITDDSASLFTLLFSITLGFTYRFRIDSLAKLRFPHYSVCHFPFIGHNNYFMKQI